ncbi:hypothetical protein C1S65_01780 [Pseudomonas putida]|uniref:Uncharacterized protein n=1 Tax=Pseudomonas putida TaxID=303 RepID=A0AAD0L2J5_PSEPU|nr:hypothetical protein C1S65_01780 [Pseudomonas putida]
MCDATRDPVGAGLPAKSAVNAPSHSRASPLPQGPHSNQEYWLGLKRSAAHPSDRRTPKTRSLPRSRCHRPVANRPARRGA